MRKYSHEIAEAIQSHLKENNLRMVSFDETLGSFGFNTQLSCHLSTNIIIRVGEDCFTTMAICPVRPDTGNAELMARMAEFVCRANFGLKHGYFEFDFNDGEIRYKCFVPCHDLVPSQEMIRECIAIPASMLRRYAPGILGVLYNGVNALDAVNACEEDSVALRAQAIERACRKALQRKLDNMAAEAECAAPLPSFDEFVNMTSHAPNKPAEPAESASPDAPTHDDAAPDNGEDNGTTGE